MNWAAGYEKAASLVQVWRFIHTQILLQVRLF